jgi:LAO/AO transport system kinase
MEIADLILVNKADGDLKPAAMRTRSDYAGALRLLRKRVQDPEGFPKAICVSALHEDGLREAWEEMRALIDWRRREGHFAARRVEQAQSWFVAEVREGLLARLEAPEARAAMARYRALVAEGAMTPAVAAREMLARIGG